MPPVFVPRLALVCGLAVLPAAGELSHRWSFGAPAGAAPRNTAMVDSISGAVATVQGNNSTFTGAALTLPGDTTGERSAGFIAGYVDLPNGIVSTKTNLTLEIWATPLSAKANHRLFDLGRMNVGRGGGEQGEVIDGFGSGNHPVGSSASDTLSLSFTIGTNPGQQRLLAALDGGSVAQADTAVVTTSGTLYHYVMTFADGIGAFGSGGGRMTWYRNGVRVGSVDTAFHLSDLEDVNNWLGRSQWSGDSMAHASFDEVRIYDHVLTAAEISANGSLGPDFLAPPTESAPVADHLWEFNNAADSTVAPGLVFTDSTGGMPATLQGNGATLTGTALRLPGTTTGNQPAASISAYLDLPDGILSARPATTIEAWVTPVSSKNWQRLFDFGRTNMTSGSGASPGEILDGGAAPGNFGGYDNLSLTLNVAGDLNTQQLEGQYDGNPPQFSYTTAATAAGTRYHYIFIVEDGAGIHGASGCQARWYRNGILQNSGDYPFRVTGMEDVNNWIGRSMYAGDSNSHLSLDELRIYNRPITQGEILASYLAGPNPDSGPPEPPAPTPAPAGRWSFNAAAADAPADTVFTHGPSGETATVRGNGAVLDGTALILPGTTTGNRSEAEISAYLDLRNGIVSSKSSLSFEAWATPLSSKRWQRLFDFGNGTVTSGTGAAPGEVIDGPSAPGNTNASDNLFLSLNVDNALGSQRIEALLNGGSQSALNTNLSVSAGTEYHYVLTVQDGAGAAGAAGCQAKWYRNAELQGSIDLAFRLSDIEDVNNWIGRSQWSGDSGSHLALNELRLYHRALSAAEVLTTYNNGADAVFPPPVALADAATVNAGQKVRISVLENDSGAITPDTLEIVSPPATGTAIVRNGEILYSHAGTALDPVGFTYRISGEGGSSGIASVTVQITGALRIPNENLNVPANPPPNAIQLAPAFPGLVFNRALCFVTPPGDAKKLFICELGGKLKVIPDVTAATPSVSVVLDLVQIIANPPRTPAETITAGPDGECGLLGLAFHPDYAANGYIYVTYSVDKSTTSGWHQRLSRFTVPQNQIGRPDPVADPASELILMEQADRVDNHNGGDLHFGPQDGYLYYATGDEANPRDTFFNSQVINKNLFSAMMRIDVDKGPDSIEPSPHVSVPTDNGIARYSVPKSNPFVHTSLNGQWNGIYNGAAVTPLNTVRTEFWATGLRSPWRFFIDPVFPHEIWLGDVGQDTYEELDIISKGGNYGWVYREGKHDTNFTNPTPPVKPAGFTSIDPIYEYVHNGLAGDSNFKGNSIIGGVVYRGNRVSSLTGSYIFGDQVSGNIWALSRAGNAPGGAVSVERIAGQAFLSNFGTDPSNGDVLVSDYFGGRIMRIVATTPTDSYPTKLSQTGLFADLSDLSPAPGLVPYRPNLSFWSDHAVKRRWFTIPGETSRMTWSRDGNWTFPSGQIWVKHFDMETTRGNPETKKRIETRVMVRNEGGLYGVSYRWNEAGTEADLVEDAGADFPIDVTVDGVTSPQPWRIPSRSQCLTCHTPNAGHALSFNTRQLNLTNTIHGATGNQIDLLAAAGYFSNTPDPAETLPFHVRPDETTYPLEARARSYFAVNCAYCHQPGAVNNSWNGRPEMTLEETGLIHGAAATALDPADKLVVPGSPEHSIVLNRIAAANGYTRMPPLASNVIDRQGVDLLTEWITAELPGRPLYEQWRATHFAALDPNGARTADADGDGLDNHTEYLLGSPPRSGGNAWQAGIAANGTLRFLRRSHRIYSIETSDSLGGWQPWDVPENHRGYSATDTWTEIPLPATPGGKRFFRFQVTEP